MSERIFRPEPMGLEQLLLGLSLSERITYDQARNTLFINFEGFQVRTVAGRRPRSPRDGSALQGDRPQGGVSSSITMGSTSIPMVSDAYFSMITYMQSRYYSTASRYTTSAFMRMKLGAGLAERNLAPHVFETWAEAQAFTAAQSQA